MSITSLLRHLARNASLSQYSRALDISKNTEMLLNKSCLEGNSFMVHLEKMQLLCKNRQDFDMFKKKRIMS